MENILRDTMMFKVFDDKQMENIGEMTNRISLDDNMVLFQQGQNYQYFYYVISGIVKLSSVSEDGTENVIEIMQKDNFFAESLMFIKKPRYPVRAVALAKTQLIAIDAKKYRDMVLQSENATLHLLSDFSQRIHQLVRQIDDISFRSSKTRVASYILRCCDAYSALTFSLDIPKSVIASKLSMKPETFSRALSFFSDMGMISVTKQAIEVYQKKQLIDFVNKETKC